MAKAVEIDGKVYRMRRGKIVEIPPEWVGRFTTKARRKKRTKAARTQPGIVPSRQPTPTRTQDARPEYAWGMRRRKMMPEPRSRKLREEEE